MVTKITKKKRSKKFLIPTVLLTAILMTSVYGASQVMADDNNNYPPIVERIASKFGLNEADVNEVFLQEKADMWEKRKQSLSDNLALAVKDGKITEEQKQMILDKKDEVQADRFAKRQEFHDEMHQWMANNGINADSLMPYMGFGGLGKRGFHQVPPMN